MRLAAWMIGIFMLTGCTLTQPGGADKSAPSASSPIVGDTITVTPLAAPSTETTPVGVKETAQAQPAEPPIPLPSSAQKAPPERPGDAPASTPADTAEVAGKDAVAAAEPPPPPATPEELACSRKGGKWSVAGKSGAKTCVRYTKDGGKYCTRQSQCEGFCLARSNSCAPVKPLFGCNDILQDNGVMVTLCID